MNSTGTEADLCTVCLERTANVFIPNIRRVALIAVHISFASDASENGPRYKPFNLE